jgi:branched-chain amino acid transport system permease protein
MEDGAPPPALRRALPGGAQLWIGLILVVATMAAPPLLGSSYWTYNFSIVNLFVTVAVMQNLLLSDAGQVSFGQGAVFGLAAYSTGIVAGLLGHGYVAGFAAGLVAALLGGLMFAVPALRVQSYYLGFVTLSAAVVLPEMLVAFSDYTNGINGIPYPVPVLTAPGPGGLSLLGALITLVTCGSLVFHAWFRTTPLGRWMRIAAVSPEAAMALGASPGRLRFLAFLLTALVTGIAGALYVPVVGFVSPYAFRVDLSVFFFFSVIVGGSGRLLGPVVGVWVLYLIPNALLASFATYRLLGYGIAALAIMLLFPDGLVGTMEAMIRRHRTRQGIEGISVRAVLGDGGAVLPARGGQEAVAIRQASKSYGRMVALDAVSVSVAAGSIHAIVGPNGSGKTTLLNVMSGFVRLDGGEVSILGTDTARRAAFRIARLGLGRTFQTPRVFEDMSVWDNIFEDGRHGEAGLLTGLARHRDQWRAQYPDTLPHAQRRLLEILRVLALDPKVILLDEPAAGLSGEERTSLATLLRMLRDRMGKTIVLIEHDLHLVWQVANRITVLDAGQVIADGLPADILGDARVRALFTGGAAAPDSQHA